MTSNTSEALGVVMEKTLGGDLTSNSSDHDYIAVIANKENLALTRFVVQRVLVPIVTSIGFFGNAISICVLTRRSMVSSTNCYLTTLAVFDLMYLIFSFTLSLKHYDTVKYYEHYQYWFPYGRVFTDICSNVSVCLTVTFSFERLIAVCYPMKGRIICTPERARLITILVTLFAIGCTTPEFCEWKVVEVINNNETVIEIVESEMAKSDSYQIGYYYFLVVTFTILPVIVLSTCNGLLIKSVLAATKIRREMTYTSVHHKDTNNRRQGEQQRITVMLISVVVVFLLCQFPNAALILYRTYLDINDVTLSPEGQNNVIIAGNIVNLLVLINASINFVLYSVMSTKFRRVFLRIFCRVIKRYTKYNSRTEMSYYNTNTMRSPGSQIRFRSARCNNNFMPGCHGVGSIRKCYNARGNFRSNKMEDRNLMRSQRRQSSTSSNTSGSNQTKEHTDRSVSKRSCAFSSNDDLHQTHVLKNDIVIWEGIMPVENISSESLEDMSGKRKSDFGKAVAFNITAFKLLPNKQRKAFKKGQYDDTSL